MPSIASLVDVHIVAAKGGSEDGGGALEKGGGVRLRVRVDVTNIGSGNAKMGRSQQACEEGET